nr:MAG TPA: hypothetical protein [Caudoviricetes sp.]
MFVSTQQCVLFLCPNPLRRINCREYPLGTGAKLPEQVEKPQIKTKLIRRNDGIKGTVRR